MLEDNRMLSINVNILKFFAVIVSRNWRVFWFVAPVCIMNAMQFINIFMNWSDLASLILDMFFAVSIFNSLLRTIYIFAQRNKFEALMLELSKMYREIEESDDIFAKGILKQTTLASRKISIFNLTAVFSDGIGAIVMAYFSKGRVHPFPVAIPGVDMTASPIYEIVFASQIPAAIVIPAMYMPFCGIFASCVMFAKTALQILQHRLRRICDDPEKSEDERFEELSACILYHTRITRFVKNLNSLVTFIVFIEFLFFGAFICTLLFCIVITDSNTQIFSMIMYILTVLYVLFTYCWLASELMHESLKVPEAIYAMKWYNCGPRFRKTILLFITRSQRPLQIMIGNLYPMNLATFQSLLNASYSYFNILRSVYNK